MKKLFTHLFLAVLVTGFISATPNNRINLVKVPAISKMYVSANYEIQPLPIELGEIHPLDILSFKFN
ncbi:MAG: hypothetical protein ACR2KZ_17745 [Segetibacter sp.]